MGLPLKTYTCHSLYIQYTVDSNCIDISGCVYFRIPDTHHELNIIKHGFIH